MEIERKACMAAAATKEKVSQRAFEIYLGRGGEDGHAMDDWLKAEGEIVGSQEGKSKGTRKTSTRKKKAPSKMKP
ncbi:MAG: DUF2934 domain-containing protein [Chitinivibrionales bacterium]|nr:DUF2934 domain-containing protein [Chitinivibrionales bacterium]